MVPLKKDLFQVHSVFVGRSCFSWAAGLRASVPYWLLASNLTQFIEMCDPFQNGSFLKISKREKESVRKIESQLL